ncbi:DeoR/GlpR family DNA-binding transcription regulator [Falsihalocynthiibacter sp. BN13B15]|uniref:DeoR/GlpR family DNA-binding transcription regulator n=1 Tax=Falsihalocynthiibacter sp. BN13B15 TaxID=3240871 RepID=UPI00350F4910
MKKQHSHSHRELELLNAIRRIGGFARNSELATVLDVSEETVRRTIKGLSKSGTIARVHGGAYLVGTQSDPSFFKRIAQNSDEKRLIAQRAAQLAADGMTLFLDVGSTTAFVAEELRVHHNLTVVTNSIRVSQTLVGHNDNRVFLLGGEMQSNELGAFGHVTETQARRYSFDRAFLSADALSSTIGFLYLDPAEADLASVVIDCADITVAAMTHHKFDKTAPHRSFHPSEIHTLVVDQAPEKPLATSLEKWDVALRVSKKENDHE